MAMDQPSSLCFEIGIIKTLDIGDKDISNAMVVEGIGIEELEKDIVVYCQAALKKFESWSEQDVKESECVTLFQDDRDIDQSLD